MIGKTFHIGSIWVLADRRVVARQPAVQRIWHIEDSQGQIPALVFRQKSLTCSIFRQPDGIAEGQVGL